MGTTDSRVMAELTQILRDVLEAPDLDVQPQTSASMIPAWDSMRHIMILMAVQDKFGIRLSTREIDHLQNVGDLVTVIEHRTASKPQA